MMLTQVVADILMSVVLCTLLHKHSTRARIIGQGEIHLALYSSCATSIATIHEGNCGQEHLHPQRESTELDAYMNLANDLAV